MQPTHPAKTKTPMKKYRKGMAIILLVSANQSAAVSTIAMLTLRLWKLQAMKMYQISARTHVPMATYQRYLAYSSLDVSLSLTRSDLVCQAPNPPRIRETWINATEIHASQKANLSIIQMYAMQTRSAIPKLPRTTYL